MTITSGFTRDIAWFIFLQLLTLVSILTLFMSKIYTFYQVYSVNDWHCSYFSWVSYIEGFHRGRSWLLPILCFHCYKLVFIDTISNLEEHKDSKKKGKEDETEENSTVDDKDKYEEEDSPPSKFASVYSDTESEEEDEEEGDDDEQ